MTWAFSLSVECGVEQIVAEQFAYYFDGLALVLGNGIQSQCHTAIFQDIEENWWCRVCPDSVSGVGIDSPDSAYCMTELGICLYQRLQSAPPFRYALVGVEVDEFRTYSELSQETSIANFSGLVLGEAVWRSINMPPAFCAFSSGYVWQPYRGEIYQPLLVSPDLQNKLQGLLVLQSIQGVA